MESILISSLKLGHLEGRAFDVYVYECYNMCVNKRWRRDKIFNLIMYAIGLIGVVGSWFAGEDGTASWVILVGSVILMRIDDK